MKIREPTVCKDAIANVTQKKKQSQMKVKILDIYFTEMLQF